VYLFSAVLIQGRTLSLLKLNPVHYLRPDEAKEQNRLKINKQKHQE